MLPLTDRRPVSLRRVSLLLVFGVLAGMCLAPAGRRMSRGAFHWLEFRGDPLFPAWTRDSRVDVSESTRWMGVLYGTFRDMRQDGDHPLESLTPLEPDAVAQRLEGLDGWSTAVLHRWGATPDEIFDAGLARRETCMTVLNRSFTVGPGFQSSDFGPARNWFLVLLDERGRVLGRTHLTSRQPGWVARESEDGTSFFRQDPVLAGGPELAPATVFRRTAEGVLVAG
jgi:hypothetical protein